MMIVMMMMMIFVKCFHTQGIVPTGSLRCGQKNSMECM